MPLFHYVLFVTIDSDNNYMETGVGGFSKLGSPYANCIMQGLEFSVPSANRRFLQFKN